MLHALLAPDESVSAPVGDAAERGDVDVDQRAGVGVLVAVDRLAGDPVQTGEAVIWQRTSTAWTVEAGILSSPAIWAGPRRRRHRAAAICFTTVGGVLVGIVDGRLDRSVIPAGPSARKRVAHLRAVGGETMNILAAVATGQRSSTMSLARRRRARGVRAALA